MLHLTLLLPLPGFAQERVRNLEALWRERLGDRGEALEVAPPERWPEALDRLLDLERELSLKRQGYTLDRALNLVVLGEAEHRELEPLLRDLENSFQEGANRGQEVRLHLALLFRKAKALETWAPDPRYPLPTRVWPLSLWSQNGFRLRDEGQLEVWIQHFLEGLVLFGHFFAPQQGRDWVGLGVARLEAHRPSQDELTKGLWAALRSHRLGNLPPIPPCPEPTLPSLEPPKRPQRQDCHSFPGWRGTEWEAHRLALGQKGEEAVEDLLLRVEEGVSEYGRQALLLGLPALEEALSRLDRAIREEEEARLSLLETFDRTLGLEGKRKRLLRLKRRGRDPQEIRRLQEELDQVDQALENRDLAFFLDRDPEASQAKRELSKFQADWEKRRQSWEQEVDAQPPPKPPSFWRRLLERFGIFRPTPRPSRRKELCDEAWRILREAHEKEEAYTERFRHYLELHQRLLLSEGRLEVLRRERQRAEAVHRAVQGFLLPDPEEEHPLVLRLPPEEVPPQLLAEEARELIRKGVLEAFWDGEPQEVRGALREAAETLAQKLPLDPGRTLGEEAWTVLVEAASPRVMARNWPDHRRYALVLGRAGARRWGEGYEEAEGFPGEVVLFRLLFPLRPEQLLEGGEAPEETGDVRRPNPLADELLAERPEVERPNPLLDEIFKEAG
jgi:hypothetical protein